MSSDQVSSSYRENETPHLIVLSKSISRRIHPGRSSDFRIVRTLAPSRSDHEQWRIYEVRPRLQRRARPRFSRGSLLSSISFIKKEACTRDQFVCLSTQDIRRVSNTFLSFLSPHLCVNKGRRFFLLLMPAVKSIKALYYSENKNI